MAEDYETNYLYIKLLLNKFDLDMNIIHAGNGIDALEKYKTNPQTDLILMDIRMPVMNGKEATKEIRKLDKDIPIIAQTAYMLSSNKDITMAAGFNDYISKPIDGKKLLELVKRYLK